MILKIRTKLPSVPTGDKNLVIPLYWISAWPWRTPANKQFYSQIIVMRLWLPSIINYRQCWHTQYCLPTNQSQPRRHVAAVEYSSCNWLPCIIWVSCKLWIIWCKCNLKVFPASYLPKLYMHTDTKLYSEAWCIAVKSNFMTKTFMIL